MLMPSGQPSKPLSRHFRMIILSWNVLTNNLPNSRIPAQNTRIDSIVSSINALEPDVAGIYELDSALAVSMPASIKHRHVTTTSYAPAKYGISMSLSSNLPQSGTRIIDFTDKDQRKAIISKLDGITIVAAHLSYKLVAFSWRTAQVRDILAAVGDDDQAVVMADFNCMPWQKPRRLLKQAGFVPVTTLLTPSSPVTFPTPRYRHLLSVFHQLIALPGLRLDDMYIKNLTFVEGGLVEGESDHFGVWARLEK